MLDPRLPPLSLPPSLSHQINAGLIAEGVNLQLVRRKEIGTFGDLLRRPRGMFAVLAVVYVTAARTERPHWASYDAGRGLLFDRRVRGGFPRRASPAT